MELHVSLTAAAPNAAWVEYIPQLDDLTTSRLEIETGLAVAPSAPGLGIEWNWSAIEARAVARARVPAG
jgi:L-alanine-DL-glutamate epimerase-like enolase superfamily enzyme